MTSRHLLTTVSLVSAGVLLLAACDGNRTTPSTAPSSPASSSAGSVPNSGAPAVQNPLPAKVLDGSPCDSALTTEQLERLLGEPKPGDPSTDPLGTACGWRAASGSGAGFQVGYQTKSDQGISLPYQTVKPKVDRWLDLDPIDGYPAIGYSDNIGAPTKDDKLACVVVVGISDQLAYSVSLTLGDKAYREGKDSCLLGRDVAAEVLKNLKARA
jgi:hypothetical protein